ncbi:MAG: serine hydroxymethyltransferase [bacterium]|nr:serine hydroxymethyltransferase [bacterium]
MKSLQAIDPEIASLIGMEEQRQKDVLEMIPSENYTSAAVMEALGSVLTNKYSEGYPRKRYYQGNAIIDDIETLAQERAKKLFCVPYVNVQALSGSPANDAVYFGLLDPGDTIMGLALSFGGHLTHGARLTFSSRFYRSVQYELGNDCRLDFDAIWKLAKKEKPKIIVCGFTAYPRRIDFAAFGKIADEVGAYLMADISHIAGLIVGGVHPSPVSHAHVVTTTTHKTLRGPRGALIMVTEKGIKKNPDLPALIDKAIIPGLQGGPHDNQTAAIAVALKEASSSAFKTYAHQIVKNAKALASELSDRGFDLVSGGTDNHLLLIDLRGKKVNGSVAALALEVAGIVVNKNTVPFDPMPPFFPSGIRLGTPAVTTRGMKEKEMKKISIWITSAVDEVSGAELPRDPEKRSVMWKNMRKEIRANKKLLTLATEVRAMTNHFPTP